MSLSPTVRRKREARLGEIVDVSARLFAEHGYAATGMAELCAATGMGRGALYHYIGSKEELLGLIHSRVVERLMPSARAIAESDANPLEKLRGLGRESVCTIAELPDHVWVFLHEAHQAEGPVRERFRVQRAAFDGIVRSVIGECVDAGALRTDLDPTTVQAAWTGLVTSPYRWVRDVPIEDPVALADAFHTLVVEGAAAGSISGRRTGRGTPRRTG
jgi:AcrR family transcriptional regulator